MDEASLAQIVKNAALLSPCHIQNSLGGALGVQFFAAGAVVDVCRFVD
jgi:hypothetical protein